MTYTYTHKKTLMPDIFWVLDLLLLLQLLKQINSANAAYSIPFYSPQSFEANLNPALFFFLSSSVRGFLKIKDFAFSLGLQSFSRLP